MKLGFITSGLTVLKTLFEYRSFKERCSHLFWLYEPGHNDIKLVRITIFQTCCCYNWKPAQYFLWNFVCSFAID